MRFRWFFVGISKATAKIVRKLSIKEVVGGFVGLLIEIVWDYRKKSFIKILEELLEPFSVEQTHFSVPLHIQLIYGIQD